jgi:hypothetical protein
VSVAVEFAVVELVAAPELVEPYAAEPVVVLDAAGPAEHDTAEPVETEHAAVAAVSAPAAELGTELGTAARGTGTAAFVDWSPR